MDLNSSQGVQGTKKVKCSHNCPGFILFGIKGRQELLQGHFCEITDDTVKSTAQCLHTVGVQPTESNRCWKWLNRK